MTKVVKIFIFCTIFVVKGSIAQKTGLFSQPVSSLNYSYNPCPISISFNPNFSKYRGILSPVPSNFYFSNLGFSGKKKKKWKNLQIFQ
jgi:hypothetical protein